MRLQEIEARLAAIRDEINTRGEELTTEQLAAFDEEVKALKEEKRGLIAANETRARLLGEIAEGGAGTVVRTFSPTPDAPQGAEQRYAGSADPTDGAEYRRAFMEFVARGVPIPEGLAAEIRANQTTTTTDASAVIPTTLMTEIIREMKSYGNIFSKVRRINVEGGVEFPILTLKPTASWIGETSSSDDQKVKADQKISFKYFGLECKIAQSLLQRVVSLDEFNTTFTELAAEAMVEGMEKAIIGGTGSSTPLGVTKDTRIPDENVVEITETAITKWASWKRLVFAKMKKAYRTGEFVLAQATFDMYIDGMVDANDQPIGRVNYGIEGGETYRFGGKTVETVEEDILPSFDDAAAGDVFGLFIDWSNYAVNTNMQMEVVKWTDHDGNKEKTKAILIADGKILDPHGVLLLKKKATASSS